MTDKLWVRLEPLVPVYPRRAGDRAALEGILYVVCTGVGWKRLPIVLFGASDATYWRRLTDWHEAGVWQGLHERLLAELRAAGLLDLSVMLVDSTHLRALKRGTHGSSPVDRRKPGSQNHPDHRRHRHPARHHADRRAPQRRRPVDPARRGGPADPGRGRQAQAAPSSAPRRPRLRPRQVPPPGPRPRHPPSSPDEAPDTAPASAGSAGRWNAPFAWLKGFRRLRIRTERRADIHQAIPSPACSIICLRKLILN